jgi:hypothetical protein
VAAYFFNVYGMGLKMLFPLKRPRWRQNYFSSS